MVLCRELAAELALSLPCVELGSYHAREKLLCLDERYLNVAVRVAVEAELACNVSWERLENSEVLLSDRTLNECNLLLSISELA